MTIAPERLAVIRALGDDEFRDVLVMDDAVEELLNEVDSLRVLVRSLTGYLRAVHDHLDLGAAVRAVGLDAMASAAEDVVRGWQA